MNLVSVPLTMKLLFLLPNLHLKHHAEKEKIKHSPRKTVIWLENTHLKTEPPLHSESFNHHMVLHVKVRFGCLKRNKKQWLKMQLEKKVSPKKAIAVRKWGRPVLLGEIDKMVQRSLLVVRKKGGVVNALAARSVAKALVKRSGKELEVIDLDSRWWIQCSVGCIL